MRKSVIAVGVLTLALTGCGSKSTSEAAPTGPATDNWPTESEAQSAPEDAQATFEQKKAEFERLLLSGDSAACAHELGRKAALNEVRPVLPNLSYYRQQMKSDLSISQDTWDQLRDDFGSLEMIVMDGANQQTKAMQCSAVFIAIDRRFPVTYLLQPSADHTTVLIKSRSSAKEPVIQLMFQTALVNSFIATSAVKPSAAAQPSETFTPSEQKLIDLFNVQDETCQDGGDDPATYSACDKRDKLWLQVRKNSICLGKKGQSSAEYRFHRCGPESND